MRPLLASYPVAIFLALFIHAALVALLVGMPAEPQPQTYIQPKAIKASLVQLEKPKPKVKPKPVRSKKKTSPKKVAAKPEITKEKSKEIPPLEKKVEKKARASVQETSTLEQDLEEWLADDASEIQAEEDLEKIELYSLAIENQVYRRWSRPPSARNNMVALLTIRLLPSGDIVSVTIKESSGNDALDRSAVSAVKRVERFAFIREMESRLFEANFREFDLKFNPQDMRL